MREPIAWLNPDPDYEQICPEIGYEATYCEQHPKDLGWIPLYAQRDWVGLTDEDISEIVRSTHNTGSFVRAIEDMLKDKNT